MSLTYFMPWKLVPRDCCQNLYNSEIFHRVWSHDLKRLQQTSADFAYCWKLHHILYLTNIIPGESTDIHRLSHFSELSYCYYSEHLTSSNNMMFAFCAVVNTSNRQFFNFMVVSGRFCEHANSNQWTLKRRNGPVHKANAYYI